MGGVAAAVLRALDREGFFVCGVAGRLGGIVRMTLSCSSTNDSLGCTGPRCDCFRCVVGEESEPEDDEDGMPCTEFRHADFADEGEGS